MGIELGVDTLCYHLRLSRGEITHEQVAAEVAELGFLWLQVNAKTASLEEWSSRRIVALGQHIRDTGLGVIYSGRDIGGTGSSRREIRDRVHRWSQQAGDLGSPILRVYSKRFRHELSSTDGVDAEIGYLADLLPELAADAQQAGVVLALENHSNLKADEVARLVEDVASPWLRVHLDLANCVSVHEDMVATTRRLGPLAISGHVKDYSVSSIYNPDAKHRVGFSILWRYPGEGSADLSPALDLLRTQVGATCFPLTIEGLDHEPGDTDQARRLARSFAYLRELQATTSVPSRP